MPQEGQEGEEQVGGEGQGRRNRGGRRKEGGRGRGRGKAHYWFLKPINPSMPRERRRGGVRSMPPCCSTGYS